MFYNCKFRLKKLVGIDVTLLKYWFSAKFKNTEKCGN